MGTGETLGLGASLSALGFIDRGARAAEVATAKANRGSKPVTITKVRAVTCAPQGGIRFVVVRVDTSEPGLYGLGCGTFNQRPLTVVTAVNEYLDPFARGRNVDDIEDIWQALYRGGFYRGGPILTSAISGIDQALWDIKGKRLGVPVYDLLGGAVRNGCLELRARLEKYCKENNVKGWKTNWKKLWPSGNASAIRYWCGPAMCSAVAPW